LVYLREEEFRFLEVKRLDFLERAGYFREKGIAGKQVGKKETLRGSTNEDLRTGRGEYGLSYESTNIDATRDSLFWSWRRVGEYWRDFSDEEEGKRKGVVRIDSVLRKR
jgi:hypothetical protein